MLLFAENEEYFLGYSTKRCNPIANDCTKGCLMANRNGLIVEAGMKPFEGDFGAASG